MLATFYWHTYRRCGLGINSADHFIVGIIKQLFLNICVTYSLISSFVCYKISKYLCKIRQTCVAERERPMRTYTEPLLISMVLQKDGSAIGMLVRPDF